MHKSVMSILAIAALAASGLTLDTAAARGHGGGGWGGGGGSIHGPSGSASFNHGSSFSGGSVQSFGRMSGPSVSARSLSNNQMGSFNGHQFSRHDFDHRFRRHHHGRNFAFAAFPFGFYNDYAYDYDYDCYRLRRVHTHWGWRLRRVYVCDYPY